MRLKQIGFINDKYKNLTIFHLKNIKFITEKYASH